jgi:hypothetical protein
MPAVYPNSFTFELCASLRKTLCSPWLNFTTEDTEEIQRGGHKEYFQKLNSNYVIHNNLTHRLQATL